MIEIWLIGTSAELDTAARALAGCGHVADHSDRVPLFGADTGRYRCYARLHVATATTTDHHADSDAQEMLA